MAQLNNTTVEDAAIKLKQPSAVPDEPVEDTPPRDPVVVLESLLGMLYKKHYKEIQEQLLQLEKQLLAASNMQSK